MSWNRPPFNHLLTTNYIFLSLESDVFESIAYRWKLHLPNVCNNSYPMFETTLSQRWNNTFPTFESTYKKCLREEWGKFAGYQLLSSFWLKVARTDEDGNTTRWDRGTLPIRNLYPKWGMLRFGRIRKVTNWIWTLWFIVSYWWVT